MKIQKVVFIVLQCALFCCALEKHGVYVLNMLVTLKCMTIDICATSGYSNRVSNEKVGNQIMDTGSQCSIRANRVK